jgi:DivIVA domain-containing protein
MDVTPRELRDVEIREAFRGYNRDEVNDLLERAAVAIEALNERVRAGGERVASGQPEGTSGRERGRDTEDIEGMLHRTLLLAQRASDEAIAEAEEKARVMVEDAQTRAQRLVADAAIEARRTTESERQRLELEIKELQIRREALSTDVDGLEHFESEYRSRLVSAMEADFHAIERDLQAIRDRAASLPANRPAIAHPTHDDGPGSSPSAALSGETSSGETSSRETSSGETSSGETSSRETSSRETSSRDAGSGETGSGAPAAATDPSSTMEVDVGTFLGDMPPRPLIGSGGGVPSSEAIAEAAQAAASELVTTPTSTPESKTADAPKTDAPKPGAPGTIDLFSAQQAAVESAALDDDSFFASLRDAVRDDAPLGPSDASERAFFDQDSKDSPSFREAFKRRR